MKVSMKKEFENIKYYLDNHFVIDNAKKGDIDNNGMWNVIKDLHLENVNQLIILADLLESGELEPESKGEVEKMLNTSFSDFLGLFPDKAFIDYEDLI